MYIARLPGVIAQARIAQLKDRPRDRLLFFCGWASVYAYVNECSE